MSKWIYFQERPNPNKRTKVWFVRAKENDAVLGQIGWFTSWRKYAFHPAYNVHTFFEQACLRDIADFIETKTAEHRTKK